MNQALAFFSLSVCVQNKRDNEKREECIKNKLSKPKNYMYLRGE